MDFELARKMTDRKLSKMKRLIVTFLLAGMAITGSAADKNGFVTNSLSIPEHGILLVKAPAGWSFVRKGVANSAGPRTAALHSADGKTSVQVTLFWDGFGPNQLKPNAAKMAEMVKAAAQAQYAPGSVEKKVELEKLKGTEVSGSFARFTDAQWVGKELPPNEFSHVASGMVRIEDLWGNFTILTDDKDGPHFKEGLAVIESLRKEKP